MRRGGCVCVLVILIVTLAGSQSLSNQAAQISQELINDVVRSIALKGCDVFEGNEVRKASELRECYASTQENSDASLLVRTTSLDVIRNVTAVAIAKIRDVYQVQRNFEWVLIHEGELEQFVDLAQRGQFLQIREIYYSLQSDNQNACHLLSALRDSDISDLIKISKLNSEGREVPEEGVEAPVYLVDYISWAIAHAGCQVFDGESLGPPDSLRRCYLAVAADNHNGEAVGKITSASSEAITKATALAVVKIKDLYHARESFEWYLTHSGDLDHFKSMVSEGAYSEARQRFALSRQHNSDVPYLLNAFADSEISAMVSLQRLDVLIPPGTSMTSLASISDVLETETVPITDRTTVRSLGDIVCGGDERSSLERMPLSSDCFAIALHASRVHGLNVDKNGMISGANTLEVPLLPPAGASTLVTFRTGVSYEEASARLASAGIKYEVPKHVALILPELNVSLASETVKEYGDNGLRWFATAIAADKVCDSDLELKDTVHVGIIDAGVDPQHQSLQPFFWKLPVKFPNNGWEKGSIGYDYLSDESDPTEEQSQESHGTHISGLVTARALALWLPEFKAMDLENYVKIYSLKIAGKYGIPDFSFPSDALYQSMPDDIHLFNLSLEGPQSMMLRDVIKSHSEQGLLVVAAGNDATDMNSDLKSNGTFREDNGTALANVIIVAALTDVGKLTPKSNYGNLAVEIAAPGDNIYSTIRGGSFGSMTGTSQAAPLVTATAAILLAEHSAYPSQIKERILSTCDWDDTLSKLVAEGCELDMAKAITSKADIVELVSGDWLYGTVRTDQLHLSDASGNVIDASNLHRIWFSDQNGNVRVAVRGGGHAVAKLSSAKVIIEDLHDAKQCTGPNSDSREIDIKEIKDIVFRWKG
jgi:hypothetical protein